MRKTPRDTPHRTGIARTRRRRTYRHTSPPPSPLLLLHPGVVPVEAAGLGLPQVLDLHAHGALPDRHVEGLPRGLLHRELLRVEVDLHPLGLIERRAAG